jgi:hypothetical protein
LATIPLGPGEVAVTGDARAVFHDGDAVTENPIEKSGLSHIWPADDGHYR